MLRPGAACNDASVRINGERRWLLELLGGRFCVLPTEAHDPKDARIEGVFGRTTAEPIVLDSDQDSCFKERYPEEGRPIVVRPDQHLL